MQRSCRELWDMIAVLKTEKANDCNNEYKVERERERDPLTLRANVSLDIRKSSIKVDMTQPNSLLPFSSLHTGQQFQGCK